MEEKHMYVGQEKVQIIEGMFQGVYGYVRIAHRDGRLWVILDNGHKTSTRVECVKFIHHNYFMVGWDKYKEMMEKETRPE